MTATEYMLMILKNMESLGYHRAMSAFEDERSATTRDHSFRVIAKDATKTAAQGMCAEESRVFEIACCFDFPPSVGDLAAMERGLDEDDRITDLFLARSDVSQVVSSWSQVQGTSAICLTLSVSATLNRLRSFASDMA